jgi:acyl carrier protein
MTPRQLILETIQELTNVPADEVQPSDDLVSDLGMDSVDAVELLLRVSTEFGVDIDVDELEGVNTVGDVFALAERHLGDG